MVMFLIQFHHISQGFFLSILCLLTTSGALCLLAIDHKRHGLHFVVLLQLSKQAVSPRSGQEAVLFVFSAYDREIILEKGEILCEKRHYPKAFYELKAAGSIPESCVLRQVKYLNNLIEQDQRAHQTLDEARHGLFLVRDGVANITRI